MCGEQAPSPGLPPFYLGSPPRVRGTVYIGRQKKKKLGSPPRVRGTVLSACQYTSAPRITPACAGNSSCLCQCRSARRDHPRVCGEQKFEKEYLMACEGSPPRVRGTGLFYSLLKNEHRITPACAGNRRRRSRAGGRCTDHPRVCGEQLIVLSCSSGIVGSPPRVRGTVGASKNGKI